MQLPKRWWQLKQTVMNKKVFISKGSTATVEQRQFVDAILDTFKTVGLDPRIMNENEWSHEHPLKAINKIISECDGAVIIAFTRTSFNEGKEYKKDKVIELKDISLPTTWNHIEGALAYSYNLPILVIAENGLKSEGLIEKGYDWTVYWTDLNADTVKTESFRGFVTSWKNAVEKYSLVKPETGSKIDTEKLTLGNILKSLTISQIWKIASAIITLLIAVATISYKIGGGKFP